jgi:hypothetical protein
MGRAMTDEQRQKITAWLRDRGYLMTSDETDESLIEMMWQELNELGATVEE